MLNLELINQGAISRVVPRRNILVYTFVGQVKDAEGVYTTSYNSPIATTAQVQMQDPQKLLHIQGLNLSETYLRFYIQSNTITSINRNLNNGGDYIVMDNMKYRIVWLVEKFNVNWVCVVGIEEKL